MIKNHFQLSALARLATATSDSTNKNVFLFRHKSHKFNASHKTKNTLNKKLSRFKCQPFEWLRLFFRLFFCRKSQKFMVSINHHKIYCRQNGQIAVGQVLSCNRTYEHFGDGQPNDDISCGCAYGAVLQNAINLKTKPGRAQSFQWFPIVKKKSGPYRAVPVVRIKSILLVRMFGVQTYYFLSPFFFASVLESE